MEVMLSRPISRSVIRDLTRNPAGSAIMNEEIRFQVARAQSPEGWTRTGSWVRTPG